MKRIVPWVAAFALGIAADRVWNSVGEGGLVGWGGFRDPPERREASGAAAERKAEEGVGPGPGRASDPGGDRPEGDAERDAWRRTEKALQEATAETIAALADSLRGGAAGDDRRRGLLMEAYRRWSELDPQGALASALGESDPRLRRDALHTLFRAVAERDLEAAQRLVGGIADRELRREAIHAIADAAGRRAPEAFGRFLQQQPDGREFGHFFRDWAGTDPSAAAAFVASVSDVSLRAEWIRGVVSGWTQRDADGAAAWVQTLAGTGDYWPAAEMLVEEMARRDPPAAAELVAQLPAGHRQRHLIERVSDHWARTDLPAALEWAESQPGFRGSAAMGPLLGEWTRADPQGAAAYVGGLEASPQTVDAARRVAELWGASDPAGALDWARDLGDSPLRNGALEGALSAWAQRDPAAAADFALSLGDAGESRGAVQAVARRWAEQDVAGALDWLENAPADARIEGTRVLMDHLSQEDPRAAAGFFERLAAPEEGGGAGARWTQDLAAEIAGRWSELAPLEAAGWAAGLPDEAARERAVREVAQRWSWTDPAATSQWIGGLPAGHARDAAAERLIDHISGSDPEAAFQWALSVGSEGRRIDLARHVLDRWGAVDPGAAQAALDASGLPQEQRARIEVVPGAP